MKKFIVIFICIISMILMTGCGEKKISNDPNSVDIVTSFYPMYIATSNIIDGANNVSLKCLASPEVGCLHDYQLTVNNMITLESADIFVINGGGMESFLDKAVGAYPELLVVNASQHILDDDNELKESGEDIHDNFNEHHEEIEHEEEEHNHSHSHEEGENPHVWVSISLYIDQIENISNELKEIDPGNANIYEKNASQYIEKLENLKLKMHEELDDLTNKNIVTFHEAFYYFAKEFGLNIVSIIEREPGTSPSARDVAGIIDEVKSKDVNAIFVEPQYLKTAANTIAAETKVSIYELDPIVSGNFEKDAYEKIMEKNLEVLLEALK